MSANDKQRTLSVDAVFDIETESWDKYVVGGIRTRNHCTLYSSTEQDSLADAIMAVKGNVFAHNGGRFDALWFLGNILDRGIKAECVSAGSRIVAVRVGDTVLRDSYALAPMPLKELAKVCGGMKTETGLVCECGKNCGGYCAIRRDMPLADYHRLCEYLRNDLEVTFQSVRGLIQFANHNDIDIRGTVGASGWSTIARRLGLPKARWRSNPNAYRFARQGYYGGRVQVLRTESVTGYRYDINSAYPYALTKQRLPVGDCTWVDKETATRAFDGTNEGIFHATVSVPDCFLPPLPFRTTKRLVYPIGTFSGHWPANELRYAIQCGARVEEIHSALIWYNSEPLLAEIFDWLYGIRMAASLSYGKDSAQAQWCKWLLNSITGKFAQSPETDKIILNPDNVEDLICPANWNCRNGRFHGMEGEKCCAHRCTGICGAWHSLDEQERIFCGTYYKIPDCGYVEWSAYLTGFVRTYWHHAASLDGKNIVYGDTDSRFTEREQIYRVGNGIGEWKFEGRYKAFHAMGPKLYRYTDDAGETFIKAKGIPVKGENAEVKWRSMVAGETQRLTTGVLTLRSAIKGGKGLFKRVDRARSLHLPLATVGDRILVDGGPTTRAPTIGDLDTLL